MLRKLNIGECVEIRRKDLREKAGIFVSGIDTSGKIGEIGSFDEETNKYKVTFYGGWCGYYVRAALKLSN